MRIAFYAPMKAPTSLVPSGDRGIARNLMAAAAAAGHEVELAARLRTYEGHGDGARQARLAGLGGRLAERLVRRYAARPAARRPCLWLTYHLYHKAPDWIGPAVSDALAIPYVVAEATLAAKHAHGPWAHGHHAALAAVRRADAILEMNPRDGAAVVPHLADAARRVRLPLFLDAAPFAAAAAARAGHRQALARRWELDADVPWLVTVAMMRHGDKLASYRLLGRALERIADRPWVLLVAGDGAARPEVEAALAHAGGRLRLLGALEGDAVAALCAAGDFFVWPAVNESMGMAMLEAQAAGLAVVAGRAGGVAGVVAHGETGLLGAEGDAGALADAVAALLDAPERRAAMGAAARRRITEDHDLAAAARRLDTVFTGLAGGGPS